MEHTKIYFPNLNGLRFVAALMVFFPHIEQVKILMNLPSRPDWYHPDLGHLGVILFFVLSGFLITYLLLKEKQETTSISVRQFYLRRVLRIWPLYYFIILSSLFILPWFNFFSVPTWSGDLYIHYGLKVFLFLLFLPNLAMAAFTPVPFASPSWSVGVEEQFYLIWPLLIKKGGNVVVMFTGVITVYIVALIAITNINTAISNRYLLIFTNFLQNFSIGCMALGGLAAYILFYKKQMILNFLFNSYFQILIYLTLIVLLSTGFRINLFMDELFGIFFSIIILNLAGNKRTIITLENKILSYLGKISYGIYMYHFFIIFIVLKLAGFSGYKNNILITCSSLLFTIIIASASYAFLESKFLKAKIKYSVILSGENAIVPVENSTQADPKD